MKCSRLAGTDYNKRLDQADVHSVDVWSEANGRNYSNTIINESNVCKVLEIVNSSDAKRRLNSDDVSTLDSIEGGPNKTIINESGLYKVLEIANPSNAKHRLNSDDTSTLRILEGTSSGNPNKTIINESGLYDVVL